jgi:hypothetical protein
VRSVISANAVAAAQLAINGGLRAFPRMLGHKAPKIGVEEFMSLAG